MGIRRKEEMMNRQLSQKDRAIWRRLVKNHMVFLQALKDFFSEETPRIPLIKEAFGRGDIATILYVARHMKEDELKQIFSELVRFSTAPGYAGTVREHILSLSREWVLVNIEKAVHIFYLYWFVGSPYRCVTTDSGCCHFC